MSNPGTTDLAAYYELEEASGTRVDSHNSYDLTDVNTVGQGTGIQGNCADFELSNSESLTIASALGYGLNDKVGFSAWFQVESQPSSGSLYTIYGGLRDGVNAKDYYQMYYYNNSGTYQLLATRQSHNYNNAATYNITLSLATWYHVVHTWDGSTVRLYLNGSEVATVGSTSNGINNQGTAFYIGSNNATGLYHDGLVDEVGVWINSSTVPLSATNASWLYNSGAGRSYTDIAGSVAATTNALAMCNF